MTGYGTEQAFSRVSLAKSLGGPLRRPASGFNGAILTPP